MIYYELLEDGTIGRSTNSIQIAELNGYYNINNIVENEEDIVYGYDNKRYLKGSEPTKPQELIQMEFMQKELEDLLNWFNWYDNQVAQYNRCQRLEIEFDKDINELDNQAKVNQERIAEIRNILANE